MKKSFVLPVIVLFTGCFGGSDGIAPTPPVTVLSDNERASSNNESVDPKELALRSYKVAQAENKRLIAELKSLGVDVDDSIRGVVVNLPDILFEFSSSEVTENAKSIIKDISDILVRITDRPIAIEGHTDSVGTISKNYELSLDRATAVTEELKKNGVNPEQLFVRGVGEVDPIATNRTDEGRSRNRRVEIIIENRR